MTRKQKLYLLWTDPAGELPDGFDFHGDAHPLAEGMWLVRTELRRSRIYHQIKWQLEEGAPLLVAPMIDNAHGWPKFKGMAAGALAWLRAA